MSSTVPILDAMVNWLATNARSFSFVLPDTLELALYLGLAAYFSTQVQQLAPLS